MGTVYRWLNPISTQHLEIHGGRLAGAVVGKLWDQQMQPMKFLSLWDFVWLVVKMLEIVGQSWVAAVKLSGIPLWIVFTSVKMKLVEKSAQQSILFMLNLGSLWVYLNNYLSFIWRQLRCSRFLFGFWNGCFLIKFFLKIISFIVFFCVLIILIVRCFSLLLS